MQDACKPTFCWAIVSHSPMDITTYTFPEITTWIEYNGCRHIGSQTLPELRGGSKLLQGGPEVGHYCYFYILCSLGALHRLLQGSLHLQVSERKSPGCNLGIASLHFPLPHPPSWHPSLRSSEVIDEMEVWMCWPPLCYLILQFLTNSQEYILKLM